MTQNIRACRGTCGIALTTALQAGLKTGMYYLRTRAAADAIKFTVDQQALARNKAARAATAASSGIEPLKVRRLALHTLLLFILPCLVNCGLVPGLMPGLVSHVLVKHSLTRVVPNPVKNCLCY